MAKNIAQLLKSSSKAEEFPELLGKFLDTCSTKGEMKRLGSSVITELGGFNENPEVLEELLIPLASFSDAWNLIIDDLLEELRNVRSGTKKGVKTQVKLNPEPISRKEPEKTGASLGNPARRPQED